MKQFKEKYRRKIIFTDLVGVSFRWPAGLRHMNGQVLVSYGIKGRVEGVDLGEQHVVIMQVGGWVEDPLARLEQYEV